MARCGFTVGRAGSHVCVLIYALKQSAVNTAWGRELGDISAAGTPFWKKLKTKMSYLLYKKHDKCSQKQFASLDGNA